VDPWTCVHPNIKVHFLKYDLWNYQNIKHLDINSKKFTDIPSRPSAMCTHLWLISNMITRGTWWQHFASLIIMSHWVRWCIKPSTRAHSHSGFPHPNGMFQKEWGQMQVSSSQFWWNSYSLDPAPSQRNYVLCSAALSCWVCLQKHISKRKEQKNYIQIPHNPDKDFRISVDEPKSSG